MELLTEVVLTIVLFILGASFASFFYRATYRYTEFLAKKKKAKPAGFLSALLLGESQCEKCGRRLGFFDLVPVFSFVFNGGKCKECGYVVPTKYPIAEALLGTMFSALFFFRSEFFNSYWELAAALTVLAVCFLFAIIDIETRRVPNFLILPAILVVLLARLSSSFLAFDFGGLPEYLLAAIIGFGFVYCLNVLTKDRAFGWGDSKFLVFAGLLLGKYLLLAVYFAIILGAMIGVVGYLVDREATKTSQNFHKYTIPFIPFLSLGTVLMYIIGERLWDFIITKFYFL